MINYALKKWDDNKDVLRNAIEQTDRDQRTLWEYEDIVKFVCRYIFNENTFDQNPKINVDGITVIDNGYYQGTLLFMLPFDTDQPAEYEYLMTYVGYGSCSACDTLQRIQADDKYYIVNSSNDLIDSYMALCKYIVSNTIRPYNIGWRSNVLFEPVNSSSPKDSIRDTKIITKESLRHIMSDWIKPKTDECESLRGEWTSGSDVDGHFSWHLRIGARFCDIGVCLCYNNKNEFTGYDVWTHNRVNVNIRIMKDIIEFIENSEFQSFTKEEMEDLYDKIKFRIFN